MPAFTLVLVFIVLLLSSNVKASRVPYFSATPLNALRSPLFLHSVEDQLNRIVERVKQRYDVRTPRTIFSDSRGTV
jgi:hypothetical protein